MTEAEHMAMRAGLRARSVGFRYPGMSQWLFEEVDFEAHEGQIVAITGPSGCGKSTLCCCLAGVIPRFISGEMKGDIKTEGRVGMVFQDPDSQLFLPTVEDELAFGPENLCLPRDEIGRCIETVLHQIGLTHLRASNPAKLSGGEKQLVALGGVLTLRPDVIFLDEALGQLDRAARQRIGALLNGLKQQGKIIIMIEHEPDNLKLADLIWRLEAGRLAAGPGGGA